MKAIVRFIAAVAVSALVVLVDIIANGTANADDTIVMGATGVSDPQSDAAYWADVLPYVDRYFPGSTPVPLTTPENFPYDPSVAQGVTDLNSAINADTTGVVGVSQSATVASAEMAQLSPSSDMSFVLLGDPNNPDGGILTRFPDLSTYNTATPVDDFTTTIYTHEYDPISDMCRYVLNVVCDANAIAGITNHSYTGADLSTATDIGTYGDTTYYMIPSEAPLVADISSIPIVGTPLADLVGPDLTYLINLGYGDPLDGYSLTPNLDVPADFGLPPTPDLDMMPSLLLSGAEQGIQAFLGAL